MCFDFLAPSPNVTLTALSQTVLGSPLLLQCNVTMVNGINSSVVIVWMKDGTEIENVTMNNTMGQPINNETLLLYTSSYSNVTQLQMNDNNTIYYCQAVINKFPLANNSDNYTLNLTGEYRVVTTIVRILSLLCSYAYVCIICIAPVPVVNVTKFSNQTLRCVVSVVEGITSGVEFVWMTDDIKIIRPSMNATYNMNTTHEFYSDDLDGKKQNGTKYYCQAIVNLLNSSTSVKTTAPPYTFYHTVGECYYCLGMYIHIHNYIFIYVGFSSPEPSATLALPSTGKVLEMTYPCTLLGLYTCMFSYLYLYTWGM